MLPPPPAAGAAATTAPSNIRAWVQWRESSVYAGEELDCIVTFKNIAPSPADRNAGRQPHDNHRSHPNGALTNTDAPGSHQPSITHSRRSSIAQRHLLPSRTLSISNTKFPAQPAFRPGHRPALSLSVAAGSPSSRAGPFSAPLRAAQTPGSTAKSHGRSLSIISLGSEPVGERLPSVAKTNPRPGKHTRSASMQAISNHHPSGQFGHMPIAAPLRVSSPLAESITPPTLEDEALPIRPVRRRPGTQSADATPQLGGGVGRPHGAMRKGTAGSAAGAHLNTNFQFPATGPKTEKPLPRPGVVRTPSNMHSGQQRGISPRPPDGWQGSLSNADPLSRVLSESSTAGTPRSSSEFYSRSNHSDETLASEVPSQYQQNGRLASKVHQHSRLASNAAKRPGQPETLMMGFVQTTGHFVIDGALVNNAPFEEVKRKGVQGGGGVVGLERSKRSSGMFGAFSWGNLGESLGGLLGGDDMSSMAQMKAAASSKTIPMLSTPQHLLFVDLTLAPGESKSYRYRFQLPRGLPPTHRGKAIKVAYSLALGVQRPQDQAVRHVEIPFRILGSYNSRGETLGHDLMAPYILLKDSAKSSLVPPKVAAESTYSKRAPAEPPKTSGGSKQGLEDFLRYTERLLDQQPSGSSDALVSPTASASRHGSFIESSPSTMREVINLAIIRANYRPATRDSTSSEPQSGNRFNITRAGQPVAVVTLVRSAFRLGEAVTGTIDFTSRPPSPENPNPPNTRTPTYSIAVELESAERVDATLSLRSASSIHRVTRKVHAVTKENTLFARRIGFNLSIPATATPTFETTGVSLVWTLRVEFTTQRRRVTANSQSLQSQSYSGSSSNSTPGNAAEDPDALLEELVKDERGTALIAKERLLAESFDVAIPLKVFGVPGSSEGSVSSGGGGMDGVGGLLEV